MEVAVDVVLGIGVVGCADGALHRALDESDAANNNKSQKQYLAAGGAISVV